jgi:hypothetical protein
MRGGAALRGALLLGALLLGAPAGAAPARLEFSAPVTGLGGSTVWRPELRPGSAEELVLEQQGGTAQVLRLKVDAAAGGAWSVAVELVQREQRGRRTREEVLAQRLLSVAPGLPGQATVSAPVLRPDGRPGPGAQDWTFALVLGEG